MPEPALYEAVTAFAGVTCAFTDTDLERPWTWGEYDEGVRFAFFRTLEELGDLGVRTAAARQAGGLPLSQAQRILGRYHSAYLDLQAALLGMDEELAAKAPAEKEWPVRQALAHLVGADTGFTVVVTHALQRHRSGAWNPDRAPDEVWGAVSGLPEEKFDALLEGSFAGLQAYHSRLHGRILSDFSGITDAELALPAMFWDGQMPLRFRLGRFESHLRQHTIQIDKTLDALGHAPGETRRLLRLIFSALADVENAALGAGQDYPGWTITAQAILQRSKEIT